MVKFFAIYNIIARIQTEVLISNSSLVTALTIDLLENSYKVSEALIVAVN